MPNTQPNNLPQGQGETPVEVKTGDRITADNLRNMIALVESLQNHSHTWTDTYGENCQCACACWYWWWWYWW